MTLIRGRSVWVLEPTDYDEYGILGVFESAEAAKAFLPDIREWVEDDDGQHLSAKGSHYSIYRAEVRTLDQAAAETPYR